MTDETTVPDDEQPTGADDQRPVRRVTGKASATMPDLTAGNTTEEEQPDG